ncbi:MAG: glycosyltransferase [Candidatus Doudnabacteria bacterium]|nr:glycosyltransferase [Candidatus Doudnabacteria bacterium]
MKIALVHDSFTQMGGAERVVQDLHDIFPSAPVFTLVFDPKFKEIYNGWDIRTSPLQALYLAIGKLKFLLPLIPWAVEQLDLSGYDIVISSSSGFVKNIQVPKSVIHICYCHTPPRFVWTDAEYVKQETSWFFRPLVKWFLKYYKKWDEKASKRVSYFIANSNEVKKRIYDIYNRDSLVIYPGISDFWKPVKLKSNYFLLAGRLQAHKKNELIVKIFNELGLPLHVVGSGRQESYLKSIASGNIKFFGRVSDEVLREQYSGALAYIFPQIEDFGLMPLEASACGTATLAYKFGGALETVVSGATGDFFSSYNSDEIKSLILNWDKNKFRQEVLQNHARKFSKEVFQKQVKEFVLSKLSNSQ